MPPGGAGTRGLVLLVIAVALGIGLLQAFDDGGDAFNTVTADSPTATTIDGATDTSDPTDTVPRALRPPAEVKVLPVNGTRTQGLGKRTGDALQTNGYNVLAAVDTQGGTILEASAVQFAGDYEPEARAIAQLLGLNAGAVQAISAPPVADTRDSHVLVLIGPELNRPAAGGQSTTTAGASRTTTSTRSSTSSSGPTRTTR